jgi:glycosyltransferase involved in cell wall biosynthesis
MQTKVSVVVTCYNKEDYMKDMLDSVIAQSWDNIELILVNDGSTDKTREIITGCTQRILERGYELIVVDQDNRGVAMALRAGLLEATGGYVCMPDADDKLMPEYVSTMAKWLEVHEEDEWTVCDCDRKRWVQYWQEETDEICDTRRYNNMIERFILLCNFGTVWMLMVRMEYLKRVNVISCLELLEKPMTQEPQVWMPVLLGGGKGTYIPKALYIWNDVSDSLGKFKDDRKAQTYSEFYKELIIQTLKKYNVDEKKLYVLAEVRELIELIPRAPNLVDAAYNRLSELLMFNGYIKEPIQKKILTEQGIWGIYRWLWSGFIAQITQYELYTPPETTARLVGYGALGRAANHLLPQLADTVWMPTELWDENGDGLAIKNPDFDSLGENDIVLVLPTSPDVIDQVKGKLERRGAKALYKNEIWRILQWQKFPQIQVPSS